MKIYTYEQHRHYAFITTKAAIGILSYDEARLLVTHILADTSSDAWLRNLEANIARLQTRINERKPGLKMNALAAANTVEALAEFGTYEQAQNFLAAIRAEQMINFNAKLDYMIKDKVDEINSFHQANGILRY
jgi:hypothetical protein